MASKCWPVLGVALGGALLLLGCRSAIDKRAEAPIAISQEAAQRLDDKIKSLSSGDFCLELSEQELTSYLALRLTETVPLASPQVHLHPEQILIEGDLSGLLRVHVVLAGTLRDVDSQPEIQLQHASLAGIAIPRFLLDSLSDGLTDLLSQGQGSLQIQRIEVATGRLTIVGRIGHE